MADKYGETLDFLRSPLIWITIMLILGSVLGFGDEIREIFDIVKDFLVEINPL